MWTIKRARIPANYRVPALVAGVGALGLLVGYYGHGLKVSPSSTKTETRVVVAPSVPICTPHLHLVTDADYRGMTGIAEREWGGRAYLWRAIWEANPDIKNPNLIRVGQALMIPCLCDLVKTPAVKKTVKKYAKKVVRHVAPISVQPPAAPPCKPCEPATVPATPRIESPATAPNPPPTPAQTQTQTQTQTVIVNQPPAPAPVQVAPPTPAPAPQPVPKPLVPPAPAPIKPTAVIQPPTIPIPPQPKLLAWSVWNTIGQNPIEPGDNVDMVHGDAGIILGKVLKFQFEPFVAFDGVKDTKGYSWNNRAKVQAGFKFVRPLSHGVLEFGTAYAAERRFGVGLPAQTKTGLIGFTDWWFGWQQPTRHAVKRKFLTGALPGTFQGVVGNVSPFERNNLIGWIRADQGFTLTKVRGISLIPTATSLLTFDTDKKPWNNRYTYGGGLKIAFPWKSGILDFQGGYQCAKQYAGISMTGGSRCGPGFSMNFWTGGRKRIGGG